MTVTRVMPGCDGGRVLDNAGMQTSTIAHTGLSRWGLVLCLALPWLNPFTSSPSTSVVPLLVSWMLCACAVLCVVDGAVVQHRGQAAQLGMGIALALATAVSVLTVPEVVDRGLSMGLLASLVCVILMGAVGRRVIVTTSGWLPWVLGAVLLAAVVNAFLGVLQYLDAAHAWAPWVNQPFKGDAFGNLRQRNQFASLTSIGLVTVLGWQALDGTQGGKFHRWGPWCALNMLAAGLACSVSRTGALQWALVAVLGALWAWRRGGRSLLIMAVSAPFLVVLWSVLMPWAAYLSTGHMGASMILRVAGQAQDYGVCGSRQVLWSNVLTMLAQKPWWGWGWGETDYAHFMTAYSGIRFCDILDNAHDLALHLALEFGIFFAMAVLSWMAVWVWRQKPWADPAPQRLIAWGWLLVIGVHSVLEYPLWYGPFQMTAGLALGMVWHRAQEHTVQASTVRAQTAWMLLACAMFLGCLYAAWDYKRVGQIYRAPSARDAAYASDPLGHAKASWLFKNQAEFAELTLQTTTPDNAAEIYELAQRLMHYSPEQRVVQRLVEAAGLLGREQEVQFWREKSGGKP